jgi:hypothetical protein
VNLPIVCKHAKVEFVDVDRKHGPLTMIITRVLPVFEKMFN